MNIIEKIQFYLPNLIFIFVIVGLVGLFTSISSYLDITNLCYINIDGDVLRGNEKTIKAAIKNIKENNYLAYKEVCRYVNKITEMYCPDPIDPLKYGVDVEGCYIKGSKVIYLKPDVYDENQLIKKRSTSIIRLSKNSKKFWDSL